MIVPMKKATVFALRRDREALLLELQRSAVMMVTENDGCVRDEGADEAAASVADSRGALDFMKRYRKKAGLLDTAPTVSYKELIEAKDKKSGLAKRARELEQQMTALETEISTARNSLDQYDPWLPLDVPLDSIVPTRAVCFHTGYVPAANADKLKSDLEADAVSVQLLGAAAGSRAVLIAAHKSLEERMLEQAKPLGFVEAQPPYAHKTAQEERARLLAQIADAEKKLADVKAEAAETGKAYDSLELLYDSLNADLARRSTPYTDTDATFYLTGWVVADRADDLEEAIKCATGIYELVVEDPPEGETPPTVVKNNKFVTPFETLTDMFSRPSPRDGIDPNPAMAPWYWFIFGMMMADVGYGFVMIVLFGLFLKLKKPTGETGKLVRILMYAGVPTIFWGVMFGSYFGAEWFPPVLFTPLYEPLPMMFLCFIIGALHMFCGMIISAKENFKHGNWQEALGNHVSWILLLTGLGLLFVPALKIAAYVLLAAGLLMIVAFSKNDTKNPFKRIFGSLGTLYGITGYASDILSYSRILALMLSSAVVGMVMNMLAGMVLKTGVWWQTLLTFPFALLIYLAGHVFNLVMSLLSAYVHASRLQYIEFYGKFYEGGGYPFRPLALGTKYYKVETDTH